MQKKKFDVFSLSSYLVLLAILVVFGIFGNNFLKLKSIYATINKYLADVPVTEVSRLEKEFLDFMDNQHPEVGKAILAEQKLTDEIEANLKAALEEFLPKFKEQ